MKPTRLVILFLIVTGAAGLTGGKNAFSQIPAQAPAWGAGQVIAQSDAQAQALALARAPAALAETGTYVGEPLLMPSKDGAALVLTRGFTYVDPNQVRWEAPIGAVIDGASVPAFAWELYGSPLTGSLRDATAIHDVASRSRRRPWQEIHMTFYTALRTSGLEPIPAKVLYAAVYHFGSRWARRDSWGTVPMSSANQVVRLAAARPLKAEKASVQVVPGPETPILCAGCLAGSTPPPTRTAEVVVRYVPQKSVLTDPRQFARLRAEIEAKDLSLEQIEDYRPPDGEPTAPAVAPVEAPN